MLKLLFYPDRNRSLLALPVRFFPRGQNKRWIYQEQQLDKESSHRKIKPIDPDRDQRYSQAKSLKQKQKMSMADADYQRFVREDINDINFDKDLDRQLDEMMAKGESDESIIRKLSGQ